MRRRRNGKNQQLPAKISFQFAGASPTKPKLYKMPPHTPVKLFQLEYDGEYGRLPQAFETHLIATLTQLAKPYKSLHRGWVAWQTAHINETIEYSLAHWDMEGEVFNDDFPYVYRFKVILPTAADFNITGKRLKVFRELVGAYERAQEEIYTHPRDKKVLANWDEINAVLGDFLLDGGVDLDDLLFTPFYPSLAQLVG